MFTLALVTFVAILAPDNLYNSINIAQDSITRQIGFLRGIKDNTLYYARIK